ncbi:MAG: beta-galactosidase [Kiritimatiellaeota bacterium]|nr:beta-galactosidase [Kiritimatiellota bacterium]
MKSQYNNKVVLGGVNTFLYGGELHYFRIPPSQWEDRVLKCKRAFLNSIGTYFPWNWHEEQEGKFNFRGDRDIAKWIQVIRDAGLYFIARPGPYICAEWDFGGFPAWLIPKKCELRTYDKEFLKYCSRWLKKINPIIKKQLITKGGNTVLYQIENEFWWDDMRYLNKLKDMAKSDGIDVPIITNECKPARGSEIIDSLNLYPAHWDVEKVEQRIADLIKTQAQKIPLCIELQCGGGYTVFGGKLPSFGGHLPERWTDVLTKTVIACGLNGVNFYMYHGGTNPAYWTGPHITTSYDSDCAIREWGELSARYFATRLIGGFIAGFGNDIVQTKPIQDYCRCSDSKVAVLCRRGKKTAFLFPRNLTNQDRKVSLALTCPGETSHIRIPYRGHFLQHAYSMSIIPVKIRLGSHLIYYTTSQVFTVIRNPGENILILHERNGFQGEVMLDTAGTAEGNVRCERTPQHRLRLNYRHGERLRHVTITGKDKLTILIINTSKAERTWIASHAGINIPIISNVYFLRGWTETERSLTLQMEIKPEENTIIECPLRSKPKKIVVDDLDCVSSYDTRSQILKLKIEASSGQVPKIDLSGIWKIKAGTPEIAPDYDDSAWTDFKPWQSAEAHGALTNGHLWYRTQFDLTNIPDNLYLAMTGFYDEATIYINGISAGCANGTFNKDIASYVRPGRNSLVACLECMGHHHSGFRIPNGIVSPVYLTRTKRVLAIEQWKRSFASRPLAEQDLCKCHPEVSVAYNDRNWEQVAVNEKCDDRITTNRTEKNLIWYRTELKIPANFIGKYICLEIGQALSEAFVFVNNKFAGRRYGKDFLGMGAYDINSFAVDITPFVKHSGPNTIAIAVLGKDIFNTKLGLHQYVRLAAYDRILNKGWKIREGLYDKKAEWHLPSYDDSKWNTVKVPQKKPLKIPGWVWYRKKITFVADNKFIAPWRVTIRNTAAKALVYFNGRLIGRYSNIGPQEHFYIPEELLQKNNVLAIALDPREQAAILGEIHISPYYVTRKLNIGFHF